MSQLKFQYSVARYVPDEVRGEAINIGLVLHDLSTGAVHVRFTQNFKRAKCIDQDVNIPSLKLMTEVLSEGFNHESLKAGMLVDVVQDVSGLISFSEVQGGLTRDMGERFRTLYEKFVGFADIEPPSRRGEAISQKELSAKVKLDFHQSHFDALRSMTSRRLDSDLGIEFEFVMEEGGRPKALVQPISLDVGNKHYRMEISQTQVLRLKEAQAHHGFDGVASVALIQGPVLSNPDGFEKAEGILRKGFQHIVHVDPNRQYVGEVAEMVHV